MSKAADIEDQELHASLKNVLEKLIQDLFNHLSDDAIPKKELVEKKEGEFTVRYTADYQDLMTSFTDHWTNYPEYSQCVDAFMGSHVYTDEAVFTGVNDAESREHIGRVVVPRLFAQYFERNDGLEFNEDLFREVYLGFEEHLKSEIALFRSWALLSNFSMNIDQLDLSDGLRIRAVSPEERTFAKNNIGSGYLSRFDWMDDFLIEAEFELAKNPADAIHLDEGRNQFDGTMRAFRLFDKGGDVRYKAVFTGQFPVNYSSMGRSTIAGETRRGVFSQKCNLSEEAAREFKEFWSKYQEYHQLEKGESISAPLRRFSQMDEKSILEDALIDNVIAFESTLLEEVSHGESFRFRMPLRASLLLDKRSEYDREFIYHFFRELYDTRSSIVHQAQKIDDKNIEDVEMNPKEFTIQARKFLRETLLEYIRRIEQGDSIQQVNKEIDQVLRNAEYST